MAYLFQFIVVGVLVVLAVGFFSIAETGRGKRNWAVKGLSIFSVLSLIINILNIVHGAFNSDPRSFGSHNTFADLAPIAILLTGTSLWVVTLLLVKRAGR